MKYVCFYCGKNFDARPSEHRKFCSRTCSNRYHMKDPKIVVKINAHKRGKTWEEYYGEKGAKKRKEELRKRMLKNDYAKGTPGGNVHLLGEDNPMYSMTHSKEARVKMKPSWFKKGQTPWNKGYGDYMKGENNPNWRGGISKREYPDEFGEELKNRVKERFNYKCATCEMTEEENLEEMNMSLATHHLDFDKQNNDLSNLAPLCFHCHGRVTTMREILVLKNE